jgi:hypothetical protein
LQTIGLLLARRCSAAMLPDASVTSSDMTACSLGLYFYTLYLFGLCVPRLACTDPPLFAS